MSGLFYLTHREFSLQAAQASQGTLPQGGKQAYDLVHRLPGISMVFFYSKSCSFCNTLKPIFSSLAGKISGVHFALANVSADNMRLQQMSEASVTPIKYVPLLTVYVNGQHYMEYRGPKTAEGMARAIYEISQKVQTGKDFATGKVCEAPSGAAGYCVDGTDGDEDVCYFTFDEAYNGKNISDSGKGTHMTYAEVYGNVRI